MQQEKYLKAEELFERALRLNRDNVEAHASMGMLCHHLGRYDRAVKEFREALKSSSEAPGLRKSLASAYFRLGQFASALREIKRALTTDPYFIEAYLLMGDIYQAKGQPMQAKDAWRRIDAFFTRTLKGP